MPRDPSGTYTAPSNSFNPAVDDTIIDPTDWNATLADLSNAMTDSLSRTAQGGMSADLDMNNNDINEIKTAVFQGSTSGDTTVIATAIAGTTTLTLPAATDTLVGKATTDTLTNKTFDTAGAGNSFSIASAAVTANTGTGAVARANSPTFVTPNLGTPSAGVGTNLTGLNASNVSTGTLNSARLAWNGATLTATPANPTGTTSGSFLMMGIGSTCAITPSFSSRLYISVTGNIASSTASGVAATNLRFGTGAAPANGAAASGTTIGAASVSYTSTTAAFPVPFSLGGVITGRTPGVALWIDLTLATGGAGTATLTNLTCTVFEM